MILVATEFLISISQIFQTSPDLLASNKMTSQYRVADSKREEFRKYLEKAGVMDALTKVLVNLYEEPEKPANALDFMKEHLHGGPPETADIEALKNEVSDLKQKVEQLTMENNNLKQRVSEKICNKCIMYTTRKVRLV